MRRALGILSVAMVTAGCVVLADAAITLAWKEPVSAAYSQIEQGQAQGQLDDLSADFREEESLGRLGQLPANGEDDGEPDSGPDPGARLNRLARRFARKARTGEGIGRIGIPSAGVDWVVVEGTDTTTLQRGPGRYPQTFFPGQGNTIGIAGHRTTYGAPFRKINKISEGDEIEIEMPYGNFTYEVTRTRIVDPSNVEIVRSVGRERLVLTACHPLYSAAQRYAVFADLAAVELAGGTGPRRSAHASRAA